MNKHPPLLIALGALILAGTSMLAIINGAPMGASVTSDCVGKPYGTPGCPLKASSTSSKSLSCGNGVVENGEECDLGSAKNGFSNCTKECKQLFCGDNLVSPALKEECEPEFEEVYALNPATGELTVETHYLSPTCGTICTVPTCDKNGNCADGCKRMFLPACVATSSASSTQAVALMTATSSVAPQTSSALQAQASSAARSSAAAVFVAGPSCGNGLIDGGEQCDDGNRSDIDACTNTCRIAACGDSIAQIWEQCDDGNRVDADACSNTCKSPACGDGVTQVGEECDDGNQSNGDTCSNACKLPRCGDMIIQQNEQCDDGNQINSDSCSNACQAPRCGDAVVQVGEECDDGNKSDADSCTVQCLNARCGDQIIQQNEECDDGNKINSDSCNNLCKLPACGNGVREGSEICDDGNQNNNDSCSNECQRPSCGDGFVQPGEFCDDGNQNNEDNCTTACRVPSCGDGLLHPREECDTGRDNSDTKADSCRRDCREPRCGDMVKDSGEECDGGDECTPDCKQLKAAAPIVTLPGTDDSIPAYAGYVIALAALGSAMVLAFIFRSKLHSLVAKTAGEDVARSIDDIPLDQIEMPWHSWNNK